MNQKEQQEAAVSYVARFFDEVSALTTNASLYNFFFLRVGATVGTDKKKLEALDEKEKDEAKVLASFIHSDCYKIALRVRRISADLNKPELVAAAKDVQDTYNAFKDAYLPKSEDLLTFVEACHKFMLSGMMSNILLNSQAILSELAEANKRSRP